MRNEKEDKNTEGMSRIGLYAVFILLSLISPPSASPQLSLFSIPSSLRLPPFLPFLCQPLSFTFTHSSSFLPSLSPFLNLHLSLSHLISPSQHPNIFLLQHPSSLSLPPFFPPLFSATQSHSPLLTHHLLFYHLLSSFIFYSLTSTLSQPPSLFPFFSIPSFLHLPLASLFFFHLSSPFFSPPLPSFLTTSLFFLYSG